MATNPRLTACTIVGRTGYIIADPPRDHDSLRMVSYHAFESFAYAENQQALALSRWPLKHLTPDQQQIAQTNRAIVEAVKRETTA